MYNIFLINVNLLLFFIKQIIYYYIIFYKIIIIWKLIQVVVKI